MHYIILLMIALLSSQQAMANWVGSYLSVSQPGMAVELNAQNEYLLYIVQNEQAIPIDIGTFQQSGNQIQFTSRENFQNTFATINQESCSFTWGEAGEFRSNQAACNNTANELVISSFSLRNMTLTIPQLGLMTPSGIVVYKIALQLTSMEPLQLTLVAAELIETPVNILSAAYLAELSILYIPVLNFHDEQTGAVTALPALAFQLIATTPNMVFGAYVEPTQPPPATETTPPPTSTPYIGYMSDLMNMQNMSHATTMSIINNM